MPTPRSQDPASIAHIFLVFFRIGLITFGGGLAMIAAIRHEIVTRRRWISEESFLDNVAIATSFPGALAVNIAFLQGYRLRGIRGVIAAVLGVILPSFLVILAISLFFLQYLDNEGVARLFRGAALAVTALIAYSAFLFGREIIGDFYSILVTAAALFLLLALDLHPLVVIVVSTILRLFLPGKKQR